MLGHLAPMKASPAAAPPEIAAPAARRARRLWQTLVPLVLVLVLGIGGKIASLDALRVIQRLALVEAQVSRVEVGALRLALSLHRGDAAADRAQAAAVLGRKVMALQPAVVARRFADDPVIAATLAQMQADAAPARLAQLAADGSRDEADALALLAASTADAVHAAITVETGALWQRVWALGGGALAGLLLTAIGGSTLAAMALSKVQGFVARVEDYARRLRQADALRATAVAEAELAAVARTEAQIAATLSRLEDARRLAETARATAVADAAEASTALADARRLGAAGRAMLKALGEAVEAPLGRFRVLSPSLQIGHTITAADRATLDDIERASARLKRMSDAVLDLVRLDLGQTALDAQPFRPELVLERVLNSLAPHARDNGVTLRVAVGPGSAPACVGDAARVQTLLEALARYGIARAGHGLVTLTQCGAGGLGFALTCHGLPDGAIDAAADADLDLGLVRAMARQMGGRLAVPEAAGDSGGLLVWLPLPPVAARQGAA